MSGIKENKLILGFENFSDFADSLFGLKNPIVNFFMAMFATMTSFITHYIWDDASAVYFLVGLIGIDAATGVWKAYRYKTFRSSKLPRILVISTIYVLMLAISWNSAKYSPLFVWLPGLVYGGLIGTTIVSIYENFAELGYLPKGIFYDIKKKIESRTFTIEDKKEGEEEKEN
jgi:hypothetical protein